MPELERTQRSFIEKVIREEVTTAKVGTVTRVYEHLQEDDDSNFEIDVVLDGGANEESVKPVAGPRRGAIRPPTVGDRVYIGYRDSQSSDPVMLGTIYTVRDRPPLGRAGMFRDRYESGDSPLGAGDIEVTGYTKYADNPAITNPDSSSPEETFVQIAKRATPSPDPSQEGSLPATVEFYDAPANDEAHITVEINKRNGSDSTASWGIKFDVKSGEVKLVDPEGYGIVSDGDGNFTWEYNSKTENQVSGGGSLSL